MDPLVLGPLLKALVERLQVALDLVVEHLMGAALMVDQVIVAPEAMVLTAETRVMTDHPATETAGPPAVVMAAVMAEATVVATAAVMAVVMVVAMAAVMAQATVAETNRSYQKETPTFPRSKSGSFE